MAHASSSEKAKLQMKKVRAARNKKRAEMADMTREEKEEFYKKMYEKSNKERVQIAMWDYEKRQMSISRYPWFRELLENRLKDSDITDSEKSKIKEVLKHV